MSNIKNIIFDLGGVILNIDFNKTNDAFKLLGVSNFAEYISPTGISDLCLRFELGQIDDLEFVDELAKIASFPHEKDSIVGAWNAMLLDLPKERIELLQNIKSRYRTFLLSNTNSLHTREVNDRLLREYGLRFEDLFERTYYSHMLQMRKPHAEIFNHILIENDLTPSETLFIDDTYSNFPEAQRLGIQIFHLTAGTSITDIEIFR